MKIKMMRLNYLRFLLIVLGIFFIGIGIHTKEVFEVLTKAINICLECIGVG